VSSLPVVGVSHGLRCPLSEFADIVDVEATPQMPKLSLLVMLDGEATDSELWTTLISGVSLTMHLLVVDEFELEYDITPRETTHR
jgi:hypothetical protein